jgi:hypothetical protein
MVAGKTAQEMYREYGIEYCKKLEANGKFTVRANLLFSHLPFVRPSNLSSPIISLRSTLFGQTTA